MNKITLYLILLSTILLGGCKDFLDLPPKNQRAVTTLEDVKSVLAGYLDAYSRNTVLPIVGPHPAITEEQNMMFEAYSDNFDFAANMEQYINPTNYLGTEQFYANKLLFNDMTTPEQIWNNYYEAIGFLNALIDQCDDLREADPEELKRVQGEMLVHRSFYIYKLQQYFAPMDNEAMGIPLYLHTGQEVMGVPMNRRKQSEVYAVIIDDLTKALTYYSEVGSNQGYNIFFNDRFINNLLAQVYWFKAESAAQENNDYQHAKDFAEAAISGIETTIPTTLDAFRQVQQNLHPEYPAFYMQSRGFGSVGAIFGSPYDYIGLSPANLEVAPDLLALFDDNDYRKEAYFNGTMLSSSWPDGAPYGQRPIRLHLFTPEDAYLIMAESYYRLNQPSDALNALNRFKDFRGAEHKNVSGESILTEIINERRKEFFSDTDKRWLDLKRYKLKTIERTLVFFGQEYTVRAEPGDYHYALPIPLSELQENPTIVPNDGWDPIVF